MRLGTLDIMISDNILVVYYTKQQVIVLFNMDTEEFLYLDIELPRPEPESWIKQSSYEVKKMQHLYHKYCRECVKERDK